MVDSQVGRAATLCGFHYVVDGVGGKPGEGGEKNFAQTAATAAVPVVERPVDTFVGDFVCDPTAVANEGATSFAIRERNGPAADIEAGGALGTGGGGPPMGGLYIQAALGTPLRSPTVWLALAAEAPKGTVGEVIVREDPLGDHGP